MNIQETGIFDMGINEYHDSEGISRSGIMLFKRSPLHYWNKYNNENRNNESTSSQIFGNAFHSYILENDSFYDRYYVLDKIDKRTKTGKALMEEIKTEHSNKEIISIDDFEKIKRMEEQLKNDKYAQELISGAQVEKSIFWRDKKTNILCKARPDIWHKNMVCDIKTTVDASPQAFQRSLSNYGYHIQAAMIKDGILNIENIEIKEYIFIAIETIEPYAIGIYILDQEALKRGHLEYKMLLEDYRDHLGKDLKIWPSYKPSIVSLPAYYI